MSTANHPWTVAVRLDDVPEAGRKFVLVADAATRAAVAKRAGVDGIARLEAAFEVTRAGRGSARVLGEVSATVRQTCVVSLDPVDNEINEAVDLVFAPAAPGAPEVEIDPAELGAPDPPEPLIEGVVDLGAIATEFLILGIDPYPRKPQAVFEAPSESDRGAGPFAALAALKKERDGPA
jgi:hypothetical protein